MVPAFTAYNLVSSLSKLLTLFSCPQEIDLKRVHSPFVLALSFLLSFVVYCLFVFSILLYSVFSFWLLHLGVFFFSVNFVFFFCFVDARSSLLFCDKIRLGFSFTLFSDAGI